MSNLAKKNYYDWRVYQEFLRENNIDDDSDTITVEDLQDYIQNHIPEDDYNRLLSFCQEAY